MLFSQVWLARRATRLNLAKPQTFPLKNPLGSNSGLRWSLVFWMSLYKDYNQPPNPNTSTWTYSIFKITKIILKKTPS